jgi:hypothetical protein
MFASHVSEQRAAYVSLSRSEQHHSQRKSYAGDDLE